jgi:hypothetical protein
VLPREVPEAMKKLTFAVASGVNLTTSFALIFISHNKPGESKETRETNQSNSTSSKNVSSFMPCVKPNSVSKYINLAGLSPGIYLNLLKLNFRYSVKALPTATPCWWDIYSIFVSPESTTNCFSRSVSK